MCCTICAAASRRSPKKKEKAPRRAKFVVPDIEDEPLSDILLLHVNQPVGCWEKLKQVFAGDGLAAEEISGKLVLSW